jgi:hypothetical protein
VEPAEQLGLGVVDKTGLDGGGKCGCIRIMKAKIFAALFGSLIIAVGCVKTVNDRHAAAWPVGKDKFEGRYERSMDQVYNASVDVVKRMGTVSRESIINPGTNQVKAIEGRINERRIWVRVESVDPRVTSVMVQARTSGGGTDLPLTHEIEKQIGIELSAGRP